MEYLKSRDFPIHLLWYWWIFWLALSNTSVNEFLPPSTATTAQYVLLIISFIGGHLAIKYRNLQVFAPVRAKSMPIQFNAIRMRMPLYGSAFCSTLLLLVTLNLAGAFDDTFAEYFAKLRLTVDGSDGLTGNRYLEVLTKILAFPLSYSVIVVLLANDMRHFKAVVVVCIINLLCFSYLWQVNYPLMQLFWLLVFYFLMQMQSGSKLNRPTLLVTILLFLTLLASAANRFGGDLLGGFQRYIVGYHLIGFSFYDYQYNDTNSILHSLTYGRSSLGFLDQILETISKSLGFDYKAASSENSTFNSEDVDIGLTELKLFNAFGTLLFGFYRDFHLAGIVIGGFLYGAVVTHARYCSARSWVFASMFLFLASAWMIGMMVNPLEQAYFWFTVVVLILMKVVNRGVN